MFSYFSCLGGDTHLSHISKKNLWNATFLSVRDKEKCVSKQLSNKLTISAILTHR